MMHQTLLKSLFSLIFLVLLQPLAGKAQSKYCPTALRNSETRITLTNFSLYTDFVPGDYVATVLFDQMDPNCGIFSGFSNNVRITKLANLAECVPGSSGAGLCLDFEPFYSPECYTNRFPAAYADDGTPINSLNNGSTSIEIRRLGETDPIITLNYFDNEMYECIIAPLGMIWKVDLSSSRPTSTSVALTWTSTAEANMVKYSIEKSLDGSNWKKIGEVAANGTGPTASPYDYTYKFTDFAAVKFGTTNSVFYRGAQYRVIAIDRDCRKSNSRTVVDGCTASNQSCPISYTPPTLAADCIAPSTAPFLTGPSKICSTDSSAALYKLKNLMGDAKIVWSVYPSYAAKVIPAGRMCLLQKTGNAAATLSCSVTRGSVTTVYQMAIIVGIPPLSVSSTQTIDNCTKAMTYKATVYQLPGTTGFNYVWYQNGVYQGAGLSKTWNIPKGSSINYEVRYAGPCGISTYYGSASNGGLVLQSMQFTASPNPAKSKLTVSQAALPACLVPMEATYFAQDDAVYESHVYDLNGNLKKTAKFPEKQKKVDIDISALPNGKYLLQVLKDKKVVSTQQFIIDK
jgi:hypothetical protein